jgi:hypothetical protein
LIDYATDALSDADAVAIEDHLFACLDCSALASDVDALLTAIPSAVRSADVGGFMTDALLNRLARDGVRVRTYALSPDTVVPCAVWEGDELMALRLRGAFGDAREFTVSQRIAGTEVVRVTGHARPAPDGEIIFVVPAASIRELPIVNVDVQLTAHVEGGERAVASYTLMHGGILHRR